MPEVDAGGVRLHYVERAGPGEPIIFVHGHHGTHHAWDGLIRDLPLAHHALAVDLRGCGGSDKPPEGYAPADYARDLRRAADALGIGPFTLVGYSLGGVVAVETALEERERIRRLVLVAVAALDGLSPDRPPPPHPRPAREVRRAGLLSTTAGPLDESVIEQLLDDEESWTRQASQGAIEGLRPLHLGQRLPELRMPSMVVVGERDRLLASNVSAAALLPSARLEVYEGASHLLPMERPGELAALIDDFMLSSPGH